MVSTDVLKQFPFFHGLRKATLEKLASSAKILELESNSLITRQHDRAIALYLLLSGTVQFLIEVEGSGKLLVGVNSESGLIIGWSVFRAPFRYMTDVRCEGDCRLLRIPHHVIDELMEDDQYSAMLLLRRAAESLASRLESERSKLLEIRDSGVVSPDTLPDPVIADDVQWRADHLASSNNMVDFLAHSSLFEGFEPPLLDWIAHQALVKTYAKNDEIFKQETIADYLYMLVDGRVGFSYCDEGGTRCVFLRALEGAGNLLGWTALIDPRRYRTSAFALELTHVVAFPSETLQKLCEQQPNVGVRIMRRVLQVISSRLRFTRVRLIASRYGAEAKAMRTILDQAAESLPVTSPLHKIPYLLENRLTLSDAFHALELTRAHGDPTERDLAESSLEILQDVHKELELYQGLQKTYEAVANAPAGTPPEEIRRFSLESFTQVFDRLSYRIQGEENLPEHAGNIVIMNHLENHMETMLPNEFRLTLDSHFVSSMILFKRYGEAPIRVIRKPELGWFGYQQYFDRLDYLYVYPGEVDEEDQDQDLTREKRNRRFFDQAAAHLIKGRNLLIAPEGRCSYTEDSPGPFKVGAFRLAAEIKPEPLIVPIAVANFDKRPTRTTFAAIVLPPFRLSEQLDLDGSEDALFDFVNQLQRKYRHYVQEAIALANN
ncbi:MAG: cyclic nucleotide-binding domain-containing protein [Gammaproteobacteria bacterium]|nr:MAG: cyclic nucleotide-binding domain-containing protein [Gammaproteobacteria bacterium]